MPFYEYECSNCGYRDEVLQKITDKPLKKCPSCGKSSLKKLMSAPVFRLKGSGWYETDFKSDAEKKRNLVGEEREEKKADAKADDSATNKSSETKGDAAKSDAKPAESKSEVPAAKKDTKRGAAAKKPRPKPAAKAKRSGRR
jgi:putative FmdB family regulatory protein